MPLTSLLECCAVIGYVASFLTSNSPTALDSQTYALVVAQGCQALVSSPVRLARPVSTYLCEEVLTDAQAHHLHARALVAFTCTQGGLDRLSLSALRRATSAVSPITWRRCLSTHAAFHSRPLSCHHLAALFCTLHPEGAIAASPAHSCSSTSQLLLAALRCSPDRVGVQHYIPALSCPRPNPAQSAVLGRLILDAATNGEVRLRREPQELQTQ